MELKQLEIGQVFELAGYEWIVLEHDFEMGRSSIVAKECIDDMAFDGDNSNDFRNSTLRRYLNNDFLEELISEGIDEDDILFTDFDLSDCQGGGAYGFCRDKIGLLTIDQYRKHKEVLALNDWWWLMTPDSGGSGSVRSVDSDGSLGNYNAYDGSYGVRPALNLKSGTTVSVVSGHKSLEDYSREELLQELLRRELF